MVLRSAFLRSITKRATTVIRTHSFTTTGAVGSSDHRQHSPSATSAGRSHRLSKTSGNRKVEPSAHGRARNFSDDEALPPHAFLTAAAEAGALDLQPEAAIQVLRRYLELSRRNEGAWEKQLCVEENIKPATLTMLSLILNKSAEPPRKVLARMLLFTASSVGDPTATIRILKSALLGDVIHRQEFQAPLTRLKFFAKKQENVEAMTLLGKILESQQKDDEALEMFRKAAELDSAEASTYQDEGEDVKKGSQTAESLNRAAALVALGKILQRTHQPSAAERAFKTAAFELDDPMAYYKLAMLPETDQLTQEVYLTKAASSGVAIASHHLGMLHITKAEGDSSVQKVAFVHHMTMAKEWLFLSANSGIDESVLALAMIHEAEGNKYHSEGWYRAAQKLSSVAEETRKLTHK